MKEHSRVLFFLMFLFLGIVASVSFWYVVLPTSLQSTLFVVQSNTIQAINQHVTGNAISTSNIFFTSYSPVAILNALNAFP